MKFALATISANLVSLACVASAAYMAIHDKDGWGWFLFIGLICVGSVKFGNAK